MKAIQDIVALQKSYYASGNTRPVKIRKQQLMNLRDCIKRQEKQIIDALIADFKKPIFESIATEIGIVIKELDLTIAKIDQWTKPKKTSSSLLNFPATSNIYFEPYGNTLIIAPWNYPFQLAIGPLIGALAAGNTVVLKPSELTPNTSGLLSKIIAEVFEEGHITVVEGGKEIAQELLEKRWDYIFFTGSVPVGKIIYQAAAKHLTPVTLELGGKSPCVVDETTKINLTARRIVWGKFVNAGQTCIAPDYILVHHSKEEQLLQALKKQIQKAYGNDPEQSEDFARIINERNYNRLKRMLSTDTIYYGGETKAQDRYIAPTILRGISLDHPSMKEEIFGPILPVLTYRTKEDLQEIINSFEKPLSAYVFSRKRSFINWFQNTFSFGGGVINDTLLHFVNDHLAFGGVGHSGIGSYHGKHSFETFSHAKSIEKRGRWLDIPVRYAPYKGKVGILKWFLKWL